jgi:hypothetical protein
VFSKKNDVIFPREGIFSSDSMLSSVPQALSACTF